MINFRPGHRARSGQAELGGTPDDQGVIHLAVRLAWAYLSGAGDGNRTRTVSLGSGAVTAARGADLPSLAVMSDRG